MKALLACLALLTLAAISASAQQQPLVQFQNPSAVAAPAGYSQAVTIDLGAATMLILSGQVPVNARNELVGAGDLTKQTEQVFQNIKLLVEASGGQMRDVVKLTFFLTDLSQVAAVRAVRDRYVNTAQPPASTAVQVSRLVQPAWLLEVEATAVIPKKRP